MRCGLDCLTIITWAGAILFALSIWVFAIYGLIHFIKG